jgi:transketolase
MNKTPGVDMTSGSLGQGLSIGLGMALAARVLERSHRTYVLMGDGEVQEGQVWEAAMAASHMRVPRLIAIVDYNNVQLDGFVFRVMDIAPLEAKWRAFGWEVVEIKGHAVGEVSKGLDLAIQLCEKGPVVIIARTIKGKGVSLHGEQGTMARRCPQ